MRFLTGNSVRIGVGLENLPSIASQDSNFPASMFFDYISRMFMPDQMPLAEYCPVVPAPLRRGSLVKIPGRLRKQVYDSRKDIDNYSHPIAAAISYLGEGFPSPPMGMNGVLHVDLDGVVLPLSAPLYTSSTGLWYDLDTTTLGTGRNYIQAVYALVDSAGNSLPPYWWVHNRYIGGGNLFDNLRSAKESFATSRGQKFLGYDDAPRVLEIMNWGPDYRHGLSALAFETASPDHIVIRWTEWFANIYNGSTATRRLDCILTIHLVDVPPQYDYPTWQWSPKRLSYSMTGNSQWFTRDSSPGFTDSLVPGVAFVTSHSGSLENQCFPTHVVGYMDSIPDLRLVLDDVEQCLFRSRVGVATSTASLLDTIRGLTANWVEFAGEFGEVFELLPSVLSLIDDLSLKTSAGSVFVALEKDLPTLRKTLKALASGHLLVQFGLKPVAQSARDLEAAAQRASDLIESISDKLKIRVRSKKKLLVPSAELYAGLVFHPKRIEVHSSCEIDSPYSGHVPTLLSLDTFGVLPTPSRLLDLAPWSWAVEYFVKYQSRIEAVECIILLSIWRASGFCHSVTFQTPRDETLAMLKLFGATHSGADSGFTGYMREVSALIPFLALRESYALADTATTPNFGILIAILLSFAL